MLDAGQGLQSKRRRPLPINLIRREPGCLNAGLYFLRCFGISHSSLTATAAFSLGAGPSLSYLSRFLGPRYSQWAGDFLIWCARFSKMVSAMTVTILVIILNRSVPSW